jgi:hypothetical protein
MASLNALINQRIAQWHAMNCVKRAAGRPASMARGTDRRMLRILG